jgi:hypothetical protein
MSIKVKFLDSGREPECPPDLKYPNGIDLDLSNGAFVTCKTELPYPAPRCGKLFVKCNVCGFTALITTAGRIDDPRSAKLPCKGH